MIYKLITYKKLFLLLFFTTLLQAQVPNSFYLTKVNLVSAQNMNQNLNTFESLGTKSVGTTAQENTYQWLKNQYLSYGYTESAIRTFTFTYASQTNKNLEVTKIGSRFPDTYVVVCGHFDTKNGPGVNDNGSGVVSILEIARILQQVNTDYSVRFINFSGEEDGLLGSQNYVNTVVNATSPKMDIRVVLNLDEIGGVANAVNNKVNCERDLSAPTTNNAASNQFTQDLMRYVSAYSNLTPVLARAYASDYMPFQANNDVITGLFEFNESTHPHSPTDVLANMDPAYHFQVTKAATAAVLHFAVANENLGVELPTDKNLKVYPNPAKGKVSIFVNDTSDLVDVNLFDSNGRLIIADKITVLNNEADLLLGNLKAGIYMLTIMSKTITYQQKLFIN